MIKKHNGFISIWKFIFAVVIVFFHGNKFHPVGENPFFFGGYIAVEFFFIVTGFYFAKNILLKKEKIKNLGEETIFFIWKKIKQLIPYVLLAYIVSLITVILYKDPSLSQITNSIWNMLLLKQMGLRTIPMIVPLWYLSVMLLSMFILYPLVRKYKKNFILIVSPIIVVLGLGYLSHNWLSLDHSYHIWDEYWYTGTIRGFIEINIGMLIYCGVRKLNKKSFTFFFKTIMTITANLLLLIVLAITTFIKRHNQYDYVMLLFITIAITILISNKTIGRKKLSNKFMFYLEKLSLPMFINHTAIIELIYFINPLSKINPNYQSILGVILTIIISMIEMYIIDYIKRKEIIKKLTYKFIVKKECKESN